MARPIPRKLLPDIIDYEKKTGEASRAPIFASKVEVTFVLIQRKIIKFLDKDGFEKIGKGILLYDYVSSDPTTIDFQIRDRITDKTKNEIFSVGGFIEQPTLQGKHHIEVILT